MPQPTDAPRDRGAKSGEPFYAALDLGTNNCRLLIATLEKAQESLVPHISVHDSFSRIVRLGEGVDATGVLSEDAMERTLSALRICHKKLAKFNIAAGRYVATEACRRAKNSAEFMARIEREIGLTIEVINTEEEAHLAFLGCSSLLAEEHKQAVVFDIGGGSTEIMWVHTDAQDEHKITDWLSVNYGVMNLADKFGGSAFIDRVYDDMVAYVTERIAPFAQTSHVQAAIESGNVQFLSTSGTVTTLAAIHLDLPRYERSRIDGLTLGIPDIRAVSERLLAMRPSERFNHPCIGPERADFIISGCAIFQAISDLWPEGSITIADRGVREGIILSLARAQAA
ncbi:MAG: Ppx/GppA phosphatase family protein [Alphaproteobacteria bacterium]|nr:Ppx/GppA phosphatase family protein [Alphaproteobacteria bacterium]